MCYLMNVHFISFNEHLRNFCDFICLIFLIKVKWSKINADKYSYSMNLMSKRLRKENGLPLKH